MVVLGEIQKVRVVDREAGAGDGDQPRTTEDSAAAADAWKLEHVIARPKERE